METKKDFTKTKEKNNYPSEYKKYPINWVKTSIILVIVTVLVTGVILAWGYLLGGFNYKKYISIAEDAFENIFVSPKESYCKVENNISSELLGEGENKTNYCLEMVEASQGGFNISAVDDRYPDKVYYHDFDWNQKLGTKDSNTEMWIQFETYQINTDLLDNDGDVYFDEYFSVVVSFYVVDGVIETISLPFSGEARYDVVYP